MLFSVIIPTYNRAAWLLRALESVFTQTFHGDHEVIVVNDGSNDDTEIFVRQFSSRVQLVTQTNLGAGAARNAGAHRAKGDYLVFLDSDDLLFPWALLSFAEVLQKHGNPTIVAAKIMEFELEEQLETVVQTPLQTDFFPDYLASHESPYFVGAGMSVLERKAFLKVGGYTERPINLEDHDLILRMGTCPGFVQITSPITLGWRRHADSATMNLLRNVAGGGFLIEQERVGGYPGGLQRRWERRNIITRHLRPVSLACVREGVPADGWRLYRATLSWHLRLGRWKYLLGFPWKAFTTR